MQLAGVTAIVSVVIPCLDEEGPIADVVREVLAQGADEVIVVDNGSRDATAERAREAGGRVVSEPRRGYGRACAAMCLISLPSLRGRSRAGRPISSWDRACAAAASRAA